MIRLSDKPSVALQVELHFQERDAVRELHDLGFLRVWDDALLSIQDKQPGKHLFCLPLRPAEDERIVVVADVVLHPQLVFDVVVYVIRVRDCKDLTVLRADI